MAQYMIKYGMKAIRSNTIHTKRRNHSFRRRLSWYGIFILQKMHVKLIRCFFIFFFCLVADNRQWLTPSTQAMSIWHSGTLNVITSPTVVVEMIYGGRASFVFAVCHLFFPMSSLLLHRCSLTSQAPYIQTWKKDSVPKIWIAMAVRTSLNDMPSINFCYFGRMALNWRRRASKLKSICHIFCSSLRTIYLTLKRTMAKSMAPHI